MFYIKSFIKSNKKGSDVYVCMDETLEGIERKFKELIKNGITYITIVSDDDNFIF